jgi:5-methylcytosine-specific restriction enzyme A
MKFDPKISLGAELSNQAVCALFGCSLNAGMNRSHKTGTLVLISNRVKSLYQDRFDGDVIHYTGEGQLGDQKLTKQNKTLFESGSNGVAVHFFEVLESQVYTYLGQVELAGEPYQELQLDKNKVSRKVWMFPLKLRGDGSFKPVPLEKIEALEIQREALIHKMSNAELQVRARRAPKKPSKRRGTATQYQRNEFVAELALRRANGVCQLCQKPAPFKKKKTGEPFLEVHHIIWLARDGDDTIENTVALCPNCHRKMHSLNLKIDRDQLMESNLST